MFENIETTDEYNNINHSICWRRFPVLGIYWQPVDNPVDNLQNMDTAVVDLNATTKGLAVCSWEATGIKHRLSYSLLSGKNKLRKRAARLFPCYKFLLLFNKNHINGFY